MSEEVKQNRIHGPGHTPGPWVALGSEEGRQYMRVRGRRLGSRFKIANVLFAADTREEVLEAQANARLIAAAPDLLEALEAARKAIINLAECARDRIQSLGGDCDPACHTYESILLQTGTNAAIAKAKGASHG